MKAMILATLIGVWLLPASASAGGPALVTTARGDVALSTGDALPPAPCVVPDGATLTLAEGAVVVFLFDGAALRFEGPAEIDPASLKAPAGVDPEKVSALGTLLSRQSSTARPAASRGAGQLVLQRPVSGLPLLKLQTVCWACDGCGEVEVHVEEAREETLMWTAKAEGQVVYGGPELAPGSYYLRVGGRDHVFHIPPDEERQRIEAALGAARFLSGDLEDDPAAALSLSTAVLLHEGLLGDALYLVDAAVAEYPYDPQLQAMLDDYETRAGLKP